MTQPMQCFNDLTPAHPHARGSGHPNHTSKYWSTSRSGNNSTTHGDITFHPADPDGFGNEEDAFVVSLNGAPALVLQKECIYFPGIPTPPYDVNIVSQEAPLEVTSVQCLDVLVCNSEDQGPSTENTIRVVPAYDSPALYMRNEFDDNLVFSATFTLQNDIDNQVYFGHTQNNNVTQTKASGANECVITVPIGEEGVGAISTESKNEFDILHTDTTFYATALLGIGAGGDASNFSYIGVQSRTIGSNISFIRVQRDLSGVVEIRHVNGSDVSPIIVDQTAWNIDTLGADALNPSGITIDFDNMQIFIFRITVSSYKLGFLINNRIIWAHEVRNTNSATYPVNTQWNFHQELVGTATGNPGFSSTLLGLYVTQNKQSNLILQNEFLNVNNPLLNMVGVVRNDNLGQDFTSGNLQVSTLSTDSSGALYVKNTEDIDVTLNNFNKKIIYCELINSTLSSTYWAVTSGSYDNTTTHSYDASGLIETQQFPANLTCQYITVEGYLRFKDAASSFMKLKIIGPNLTLEILFRYVTATDEMEVVMGSEAALQSVWEVDKADGDGILPLHAPFNFNHYKISFYPSGVTEFSIYNQNVVNTKIENPWQIVHKLSFNDIARSWDGQNITVEFGSVYVGQFSIYEHELDIDSENMNMYRVQAPITTIANANLIGVVRNDALGVDFAGGNLQLNVLSTDSSGSLYVTDSASSAVSETIRTQQSDFTGITDAKLAMIGVVRNDNLAQNFTTDNLEVNTLSTDSNGALYTTLSSTGNQATLNIIKEFDDRVIWEGHYNRKTDYDNELYFTKNNIISGHNKSWNADGSFEISVAENEESETEVASTGIFNCYNSRTTFYVQLDISIDTTSTTANYNALRIKNIEDETGVYFETLGNNTRQWKVISAGVDTPILQTSWNIDRFDGSGTLTNPSGVTIDFTQNDLIVTIVIQITLSSVSCGFFMDGQTYWAHKFNLRDGTTQLIRTFDNYYISYLVKSDTDAGSPPPSHLAWVAKLYNAYVTQNDTSDDIRKINGNTSSNSKTKNMIFSHVFNADLTNPPWSQINGAFDPANFYYYTGNDNIDTHTLTTNSAGNYFTLETLVRYNISATSFFRLIFYGISDEDHNMELSIRWDTTPGDLKVRIQIDKDSNITKDVHSPDWNIDKADGTGFLPIIDPTTFNLYRITFNRNGFVEFSIFDPSELGTARENRWHVVHRLTVNNQFTEYYQNMDMSFRIRYHDIYIGHCFLYTHELPIHNDNLNIYRVQTPITTIANTNLVGVVRNDALAVDFAGGNLQLNVLSTDATGALYVTDSAASLGSEAIRMQQSDFTGITDAKFNMIGVVRNDDLSVDFTTDNLQVSTLSTDSDGALYTKLSSNNQPTLNIIKEYDDEVIWEGHYNDSTDYTDETDFIVDIIAAGHTNQYSDMTEGAEIIVPSNAAGDTHINSIKTINCYNSRTTFYIRSIPAVDLTGTAGELCSIRITKALESFIEYRVFGTGDVQWGIQSQGISTLHYNRVLWNIDQFDGSGDVTTNPSGLTLNFGSETQVLIIVFQITLSSILGGFFINGQIYWSHKFNLDDGSNPFIKHFDNYYINMRVKSGTNPDPIQHSGWTAKFFNVLVTQNKITCPRGFGFVEECTQRTVLAYDNPIISTNDNKVIFQGYYDEEADFTNNVDFTHTVLSGNDTLIWDSDRKGAEMNVTATNATSELRIRSNRKFNCHNNSTTFYVEFDMNDYMDVLSANSNWIYIAAADFTINDSLGTGVLFWVTGNDIRRWSLAVGGLTRGNINEGSWNIDNFDGNGPSGITVDWTLPLIYVFEVTRSGFKCGFHFNNVTHWSHFFNTMNVELHPSSAKWMRSHQNYQINVLLHTGDDDPGPPHGDYTMYFMGAYVTQNGTSTQLNVGMDFTNKQDKYIEMVGAVRNDNLNTHFATDNLQVNTLSTDYQGALYVTNKNSSSTPLMSDDTKIIWKHQYSNAYEVTNNVYYNHVINVGAMPITYNSTDRCADFIKVNQGTGSSEIFGYKKFDCHNKVTRIVVHAMLNVEATGSSDNDYVRIQFKNRDTDSGLVFYNRGLEGASIHYRINAIIKDEVLQDDWNIDTFDGNGPSGIFLFTRYINKYVFEISMGGYKFGIINNGEIYWGHQKTLVNQQAGSVMNDFTNWQFDMRVQSITDTLDYLSTAKFCGLTVLQSDDVLSTIEPTYVIKEYDDEVLWEGHYNEQADFDTNKDFSWSVISGDHTVSYDTTDEAIQVVVGVNEEGSAEIYSNKTFNCYNSRTTFYIQTDMSVDTSTNNNAQWNRLSIRSTLDNTGVYFQTYGNTVKRLVLTSSGIGVDVNDGDWNIDNFDGQGPSGITIDWDSIITFVFQFIFTSKVLVGFLINGKTYWAHAFNLNYGAVPLLKTFDNYYILFETKSTTNPGTPPDAHIGWTIKLYNVIVTQNNKTCPRGLGFVNECTQRTVLAYDTPIISTNDNKVIFQGYYDDQDDFTNDVDFTHTNIEGGSTIIWDGTRKGAEMNVIVEDLTSRLQIMSNRKFNCHNNSTTFYIEFDLHDFDITTTTANLLYIGLADTILNSSGTGIYFFAYGNSLKRWGLKVGSFDRVLVNKGSWNIDNFDGNGPSGITVDWTLPLIYVFEVTRSGFKCGFHINNVTYWSHYYNTMNVELAAGTNQFMNTHENYQINILLNTDDDAPAPPHGAYTMYFMGAYVTQNGTSTQLALGMDFTNKQDKYIEMVGAVRQDTIASLVPNDLQVTPLQVDSVGALYVTDPAITDESTLNYNKNIIFKASYSNQNDIDNDVHYEHVIGTNHSITFDSELDAAEIIVATDANSVTDIFSKILFNIHNTETIFYITFQLTTMHGIEPDENLIRVGINARAYSTPKAVWFQVHSDNSKQLWMMNYHGPSLGAITVDQGDWNIDPLDSTGPTGYILDQTNITTLVIICSLNSYKCGFLVGKTMYWAHVFETISNVGETRPTKKQEMKVWMSIYTLTATSHPGLSCFFYNALVTQNGTSNLQLSSNFTSTDLPLLNMVGVIRNDTLQPQTADKEVTLLQTDASGRMYVNVVDSLKDHDDELIYEAHFENADDVTNEVDFFEINKLNFVVSFDTDENALRADIALNTPGTLQFISRQSFNCYNSRTTFYIHALFDIFAGISNNNFIQTKISWGPTNSSEKCQLQVTSAGKREWTLRSERAGTDIETDIIQTDWNLDQFNGTGVVTNPSGITIDFTQSLTVVFEFKLTAITCGFAFNGQTHWAHRFNLRNNDNIRLKRFYDMRVVYSLNATSTHPAWFAKLYSVYATQRPFRNTDTTRIITPAKDAFPFKEIIYEKTFSDTFTIADDNNWAIIDGSNTYTDSLGYEVKGTTETIEFEHEITSSYLIIEFTAKWIFDTAGQIHLLLPNAQNSNHDILIGFGKDTGNTVENSYIIGYEAVGSNHLLKTDVFYADWNPRFKTKFRFIPLEWYTYRITIHPSGYVQWSVFLGDPNETVDPNTSHNHKMELIHAMDGALDTSGTFYANQTKFKLVLTSRINIVKLSIYKVSELPGNLVSINAQPIEVNTGYANFGTQRVVLANDSLKQFQTVINKYWNPYDSVDLFNSGTAAINNVASGHYVSVTTNNVAMTVVRTVKQFQLKPNSTTIVTFSCTMLRPNGIASTNVVLCGLMSNISLAPDIGIYIAAETTGDVLSLHVAKSDTDSVSTHNFLTDATNDVAQTFRIYIHNHPQLKVEAYQLANETGEFILITTVAYPSSTATNFINGVPMYFAFVCGMDVAGTVVNELISFDIKEEAYLKTDADGGLIVNTTNPNTTTINKVFQDLPNYHTRISKYWYFFTGIGSIDPTDLVFDIQSRGGYTNPNRLEVQSDDVGVQCAYTADLFQFTPNGIVVVTFTNSMLRDDVADTGDVWCLTGLFSNIPPSKGSLPDSGIFLIVNGGFPFPNDIYLMICWTDTVGSQSVSTSGNFLTDGTVEEVQTFRLVIYNYAHPKVDAYQLNTATNTFDLCHSLSYHTGSGIREYIGSNAFHFGFCQSTHSAGTILNTLVSFDILEERYTNNNISKTIVQEYLTLDGDGSTFDISVPVVTTNDWYYSPEDNFVFYPQRFIISMLDGSIDPDDFGGITGANQPEFIFYYRTLGGSRVALGGTGLVPITSNFDLTALCYDAYHRDGGGVNQMMVWRFTLNKSGTVPKIYGGGEIGIHFNTSDNLSAIPKFYIQVQGYTIPFNYDSNWKE